MHRLNTNTKENKILTTIIIIFIVFLHICIIGINFKPITASTVGKKNTTKFIFAANKKSTNTINKKNTVQKNQKNKIKKKKQIIKKISKPKQKTDKVKKAENNNETKKNINSKNTKNENEEITEPNISAEGNAKIDFTSIILQRIEEKKIYPKAAQKRGQEGNIKLSLKISKSGELISVKIEKPCKYKFLNQAAIASVKAASPFKFEEAAPRNIQITLVIQYKLN